MVFMGVQNPILHNPKLMRTKNNLYLLIKSIIPDIITLTPCSTKLHHVGDGLVLVLLVR